MNPIPPCVVCGTPVEMELDTSAIRFSSGVASTVIAIEHPTLATCPACGTVLRLEIVGIAQVNMRTVQVPAAKRPLVVPARHIQVG